MLDREVRTPSYKTNTPPLMLPELPEEKSPLDTTRNARNDYSEEVKPHTTQVLTLSTKVTWPVIKYDVHLDFARLNSAV